MLRSKEMLTFFMPLLKKAKYVIVYYTNKTRLRDEEVNLLSTRAKLVMKQERPDIPSLIPNIILGYTMHCGAAPAPTKRRKLRSTVTLMARRLEKNPLDLVTDQGPKVNAEAWCALYCGGSHKIKDELKKSALRCNIGSESELFDW